MTYQDRARAIGIALALCLLPLAQAAHADDESNRSKNRQLIQSFTPYERAMYYKQQGKYAEAIEILEPMAAQGHGFEMAQLSLGQCYIASSATMTPPEASHDALVKGTKWVLAASDAGLPAAQVQLIHMMLDGGRFKVEPAAAGMWYLIWKRNPARMQTGMTDLDPTTLHKLQAALTPDDWRQAQAQADAAARH
jgi:TPR repeat protein